MIVKIVTIINWAIISILGFALVMDLFFATSAGGGDAAGRGIGKAVVMIFGCVFILMVILNVLSYDWSKYLALFIFTVPFIFYYYTIRISPIMEKRKTDARNEALWAAPIFEDKSLDLIARTIRDADTPKLKKLLKAAALSPAQRNEILQYAIGEASGSSYGLEDKIGYVHLLFDMGASLDSLGEEDIPIHYAAAVNGNAALLKVLFEHGADAKAVHPTIHRPLLFESINGYMAPDASVDAFLEYGADPNSTSIEDDDQGPITPLLAAARFGNWNMCMKLIAKGARTDYKARNGDSLQKFLQNAEAEGYANKPGFEQLKAMIK
jgi:hypothetical protein